MYAHQSLSWIFANTNPYMATLHHVDNAAMTTRATCTCVSFIFQSPLTYANSIHHAKNVAILAWDGSPFSVITPTPEALLSSLAGDSESTIIFRRKHRACDQAILGPGLWPGPSPNPIPFCATMSSLIPTFTNHTSLTSAAHIENWCSINSSVSSVYLTSAPLQS